MPSELKGMRLYSDKRGMVGTSYESSVTKVGRASDHRVCGRGSAKYLPSWLRYAGAGFRD